MYNSSTHGCVNKTRNISITESSSGSYSGVHFRSGGMPRTSSVRNIHSLMKNTLLARYPGDSPAKQSRRRAAIILKKDDAVVAAMTASWFVRYSPSSFRIDGAEIGLRSLNANGEVSPNYRSCDFTAHMCTGIIHENYKLFVNPLFKTNLFCTYL